MKHFKFGSGNKNFVILPGLSVHGIMSFADGIAEAYAEFSKEYTVYVFDRTDDITDGCTIKSMSDGTAEAMRALNIENADIFGASQGGMIAMLLAAEHPELVGKLILASTLAEKKRYLYRRYRRMDTLGRGKKRKRAYRQLYKQRILRKNCKHLPRYTDFIAFTYRRRRLPAFHFIGKSVPVV